MKMHLLYLSFAEHNTDQKAQIISAYVKLFILTQLSLLFFMKYINVPNILL